MGNSYLSIAKSTGFVACGRVLMMAFAIVNTKVLAVVLGTAGMGLYSVLFNALEFAACICTLGLVASGVRRIAQHGACTDTRPTRRVAFLVIFLMSVFSFAGSGFILLLSRHLGKFILGDSGLWWMLAVSSGYVLLKNFAEANYAILNGIRKIKRLVQSQVIGALIGSALVSILAFALGEKSIPLCLIALVASAAVISHVFRRREIRVLDRYRISECSGDVRVLLSLGVCLLCSVVAMQATGFLEKVYLRSLFGYECVGIYQACWQISNSYVGIILVAMGVDYLPRLTRIVEDHPAVVRNINEQLELGLAIAGIGVVAVYVFAPIGLSILYTKDFVDGASIIRWQVLGVLLRVLAFPFSYYLIAKGRGLLYVVAQVSFFVIECMMLMLVAKFGGVGLLGLNYPLAYIVYLIVNAFIVVRSVGYKPSRRFVLILAKTLVFLAVVIAIVRIFESVAGYIAGTTVLCVHVIYVYRKIIVGEFGINVLSLLREHLQK